jgi:hypothetical protein
MAFKEIGSEEGRRLNEEDQKIGWDFTEVTETSLTLKVSYSEA